MIVFRLPDELMGFFAVRAALRPLPFFIAQNDRVRCRIFMLCLFRRVLFVTCFRRYSASYFGCHLAKPARASSVRV